RAALAVANAVNYVSAGTVEFLVARDGSFYFIEMNTRIQVEHPVTEMITGLDLVREQIRIAAGESLGYKQDAVRFNGHALECRINAEDPETFARSAGRCPVWVPPGGRNVRVDSHLYAGYVVPPHYDSLIAKIIVHGADRAEAIARMQRALAETLVEGVKTTIPYHQKLLSDPAFVSGQFSLPRLEHALSRAAALPALRHPRPRRRARPAAARPPRRRARGRRAGGPPPRHDAGGSPASHPRACAPAGRRPAVPAPRQAAVDGGAAAPRARPEGPLPRRGGPLLRERPR